MPLLKTFLLTVTACCTCQIVSAFLLNASPQRVARSLRAADSPSGAVQDQPRTTTVHFNRALKGLVNDKKFDKLDETFEQMGGADYTLALAQFAAQNQYFANPERICVIKPLTLKQMEAANCKWDDVTVRLLVDTYKSQGNLQATAEVFERAREEECLRKMDAQLYDDMIGIYRQSGQTEAAMELCSEMRAQRINPTKEGYAFIATVAVRDNKTYLIGRTLQAMEAEGFPADDIAYVREIILAELPDHLKHQVDGRVVDREAVRAQDELAIKEAKGAEKGKGREKGKLEAGEGAEGGEEGKQQIATQAEGGEGGKEGGKDGGKAKQQVAAKEPAEAQPA